MLLNTYPKWFQIISVVRVPTLVDIVALIIPWFNDFFLKHLPPFIERPLAHI